MLVGAEALKVAEVWADILEPKAVRLLAEVSDIKAADPASKPWKQLKCQMHVSKWNTAKYKSFIDFFFGINGANTLNAVELAVEWLAVVCFLAVV